MQFHTFTNLVKSLVLVTLIPISAFSQAKIYDFEKADSLEYPSQLVLNGNTLSGIGTRMNDSLLCRQRLVAYNIVDGKMLYEKKVDSLGNLGCTRTLDYSVSNGKSKMLLSPVSQSRLSILEFDENGYTTIPQEDNTNYYVTGPPSISRIDSNEFNCLFVLSKITDSTQLGLMSYRYVNNGTSLVRDLLWETTTTIKNVTQAIRTFSNETYTSTVIMYQKVSDAPVLSDSVSGFEMYRYNNLTHQLDYKFVELEDNYFFVRRCEFDGHHYIIAKKAPISLRAKVPNDGQYLVMEYLPDSNSIVTVKELNFNNNDVVLAVAYDKYSQQIIFVGSTVRSPDRVYLDTYTDYWIASTDKNFNIICQKNFEQSSNDFYGEIVTNIIPIKEGLIIYKTEYNMFELEQKKVMSLYSRDILSGVEAQTQENAFSAFPNPVESNILNIESTHLPYDYQIIDATGRTVSSGYGIVNPLLKLDISKLTTGCYFLKIGSKVQKFIKSY